MPPTIAISHPTTIIFRFFFFENVFYYIVEFSNIFLHMSINVCTYVCMYVCMYVCIYII